MLPCAGVFATLVYVMTATWAALTIAAVLAALTMVAALLLATCGSSEAIDRQPLTIIAANGTTARLMVEIADTPEKRQTGLMHRTELPPDTGMLFVIEPPGRGFYMKDTRIPLTVAFIERCGAIVDFADLEPLSEEIKNTDKPYEFALEVDRGWFERNGIAAGDIVSLPRDLRPSGC
jgi:uncharacterized membrane protein (UPF0127 family)